ncbi:MAG: phosphoribosylformylglycinamidine synthase subunit PurS [Acidimicrobiia bacterium]|nr:phosphoribosylformylglycinamidine synthase subunit PurS [Acidimicrobiia bacterium]MDH4307325.1 phosphoribosylformylglycinamidine synthase subunit PurS [Acidimicrobiia bacterium]MDH5292107.1 phosphoribosylformylglycinamidine synthase subunit PurS [Acidimicrobiia bacterium]
MKVTVNITRRPEIADPQGTTVRRALVDLGHDAVREVRIDRTIHLEVEGHDSDTVHTQVSRMCEQLLSNPVLEDFEVVVHG